MPTATVTVADVLHQTARNTVEFSNTLILAKLVHGYVLPHLVFAAFIPEAELPSGPFLAAFHVATNVTAHISQLRCVS